MSEKMKLRRCPFCGGEPALSNCAHDGAAYAVVCLACCCEGPLVWCRDVNFDDEVGFARVAELWNRNCTDLQRTCSVSAQDLDDPPDWDAEAFRPCPFCGCEPVFSSVAGEGSAYAVFCGSCGCEGPSVPHTSLPKWDTGRGRKEATALWNARVANDLQAMVEEFHRVGDHPIRKGPQVPSSDEVRHRLRLIAEEFFEMLEACGQRELGYLPAKNKILMWIENIPIAVELPALVDAWADLKYVIVGSEIAFGVDGNAMFRVVHEANMKKFGPGAHKDERGEKTLKPEGWMPPDIEGELERQRREAGGS